MAMLERLRQAHPGTDLTAYDGHYTRIGDPDIHLLHHLVAERDGRRTSITAEEPGRRKQQPPKAVEARLDRLLTQFEAAA